MSVLYESPDTPRSDILQIKGTEENVSKIQAAFRAKYGAKPLAIFPAKRIVMSHMNSISVQGDVTLQAYSGLCTIPSAAVLVQKWGYGYYHFVNEMLPKILRIYEYDPKMPIITFYNDFIKEILEYAGVTNPIIEYRGQLCTVKDAIHITDTASGNPTPDDIRLIRKHLRISDEGPRDTIILIYRRGPARTIKNFFDLKEAVQKRFPQTKIAVFDSMPFPHAVRLFQRAKLIIAPHGAGLSNMILAPRGTPIIEISPAEMFNACFWHLSWILDNPHTFIAAPGSNNMIVDPELVLSATYTNRVLTPEDNIKRFFGELDSWESIANVVRQNL